MKYVISKDIDAAIKSRAKYLSSIYYSLDEEDLTQDGYLLILEIRNRYPDAPFLYLTKAINNMFSSKSKKAQEHEKKTRSVGLGFEDNSVLDIPDNEIQDYRISEAIASQRANKNPEIFVQDKLLRKFGISKQDIKALVEDIKHGV